MKKITAVLVSAIVAASLFAVPAFAADAESVAEKPSVTAEEMMSFDIQYVLFLGTNDMDTNKPVFTEDEGRESLKQILVEHFGGYTIAEAEGGWVNDDGTLSQEHTFIIYLSDTTLDEVHAAADTMREVFRQSSVLIQTNPTLTEFYGG